MRDEQLAAQATELGGPPNDEFVGEVYDFLDMLRESGVTNMFGARPYIVDEFGVDKEEAKTLLLGWMQTFEQRHPR